MRKKGKKGKALQIIEYAGVYLIISVTRFLPLPAVHLISKVLGDLLFFTVPKRRNIALDNLRNAFRGEKDEAEIKTIARESCRSFFLTYLEMIKFRLHLISPERFEDLKERTEGVEILFRKAKAVHDESGGCIFVTPHIGNWEFLPYVSSMVGIPLVVVVRPLDNPYLERLLYRSRSESGQAIIPKRNALFMLQKTLREGKSVGMLPDQSTMKGIPVDFFGRKATTTPVPAMLATMYKRPIVVVACCRSDDGKGFEGYVSDPVRPGEYESEKEEIYRLTQEMNREMERVVRKYPLQYLWIHNRWKTYRGKKTVME
ncbi:MAG TPA: hypothetical protein ENH07_10710 [Nitrospirae bacterium]|nr:hypothetical protein [Nitrospirota bacterium]